jgi:quercetin dioxygenase-like cupin family protein
MALDHAKPGQAVDIGPLGIALRESATHAILKTRSLEVIRVVLQGGQTLPSHAIRGEATLLCIEGAAEVIVDGTACELLANQFVLLPARAAHTMRALEDTSLLWTIHLPAGEPGSASATS